MRDLIFAGLLFAALPIVLFRPFFGVILWAMLAYLNPHRMMWGFAYDFHFSQLVAMVTVVGLLISNEPKRLPMSPLLVVWVIWVAWMSFTTLFALNPAEAHEEWARMLKIQFMTLLTILLTTTPRRLNTLLAVIALSLGYFGVKGGLFALATGGRYQVMGPEGSFIEGNTALGLALAMCLPIAWYLWKQTRKVWLRRAMLAAMVLTSLAILASQSRGALLAIAAMATVIWWRSSRKVSMLLALVVVGGSLLVFMPQSWYDRMATIGTYEQDASAMGRVNAWHFAYNLALDRPVIGGGYDTFTPELFARYAPNPTDFHDAHSIYFEVLAEHGFVGLAFFLLLGFLALRSLKWSERTARTLPETAWAADASAMIFASIVTYAVGGAFLGLAYFDLYYHLLAVTILLRSMVADAVARAASQEPGGKPATPVSRLPPPRLLKTPGPQLPRR